MSPVEVSSSILSYLIRALSFELDLPLTDSVSLPTVITVPA